MGRCGVIRDSHAGQIAQLRVVRAVRVLTHAGVRSLFALFSFLVLPYSLRSTSSRRVNPLKIGVAPIIAESRKRAGRIKGATN